MSTPLLKIDGIKPEHLMRMTLGFRETVLERIAELRPLGNPNSLQAMSFFQYLLSEVDEAFYDRVRRQFLDDPASAANANMLKYLDPINWFESKLSIARWLKLDEQTPKRILDLGTGPGHFPVVARFFGHSAVGTDLPNRSRGLAKSGHLYDALCELYRVERISHRIGPFAAFGDMRGRYDLVTAFLAAFNIDEQKRPWTVRHWQFFLADLSQNVLSERGTLFMRLTHDKLTDESWSYLTSISTWKEDQSRQVHITDFSSVAMPTVSG
jgi:hypothetical protein